MDDIVSREDPTEPSFEEAIGRLEAVARRLEDPETPLEEAVSLYEEGVRLARRCAARLEQAELRIETLRTDDGPESDETNES